MLSQGPVYHYHSGIVSVKPRVSVVLAFRENVVSSGGNGLGYQDAQDIRLKKHSIVAVTKKVLCPERIENI